MTLRHRVFIMLAVLTLAGCKQEALYVGLSQTEANEMLSLMYSYNLPAEKLVAKDGSYSITTVKKSFAPAMALLQANGLPREQFESMGEVFHKEGFVSSPLEERARLNFALSQEISRTISSINGVIMARVHLVIPEAPRLSKERRPASASVFVKHRSDVDLSNAVGKIKSIVINGVENLPYKNVTVAFFDAPAFEPSQLPRPAIAEDKALGTTPEWESNFFRAALAAPGPKWFALPLIIAGFGAYLLWRRRNTACAGTKESAGER
jgi:type III secretion protein J